MKKLLSVFACLSLFCGVMLASAVHSAAYLDPSVVTYIISIASAIVVAGGAGVAIYWKRIKLAMKKRKDKKNKSVNEITQPAEAKNINEQEPQNKNLAD